MTEDPRHPLTAVMRRQSEPSSVRRLEEQIERGRRAKRSRALMTRLALASSAAAAAAGLLFAWSPHEGSNELAREDGVSLRAGWMAPKAYASTVHLADGSVLDVDRASELSLASVDPTLVGLRLAEGSIELRIRPGGPRRWRVVTPHLVATVLGTQFRVTADREHSRVTVFQGRVLVERGSARAPVVLGPGESAMHPLPSSRGRSVFPRRLPPPRLLGRFGLSTEKSLKRSAQRSDNLWHRFTRRMLRAHRARPRGRGGQLRGPAPARATSAPPRATSMVRRAPSLPTLTLSSPPR